MGGVGKRLDREGLGALSCERGQASVELVGTLPFLLLAGLVAWQLALAGHASWAVANAARVAARADAVGRDAEEAARSALPARLRERLRVDRDEDTGALRVRARVPLLLPGWEGPLSVTAKASLEPAP